MYADNKYDLVVFFFKERSILNVEDLILFDFNELMFVPGIKNELVYEVQAVFQSCLTINTSEEIEKVVIDNKKACDVDELPKTIYEHTKLIAEGTVACIPDALIATVYSDVPRSTSFLHSCISQGKIRMSQLSEDDFDRALSLKGLGASSVEALREIYQQYIKGERIKDTTTAKRLEHISIDQLFNKLPKGDLFIRHCRSKGVENVSQLQGFSFKDTKIRGIGSSTMEVIYQAYLEVLKLPLEDTQESALLEDIPMENMSIPVCFLDRLGMSKDSIEVLIENGYTTIKDMCQIGVSPYEYSLIQYVIPFLRTPITTHFSNQLSNEKDTSRKCLIQKSQGDTLQKIANEIGVTRERVRQIILKTIRSLMDSAEMIAETLMQAGEGCFTFPELQQLFKDMTMAECCKYVLLESNEVQYLSFSDKFVRKTLCPNDLDFTLQQFAADIVGQGMNFYDHLEMIESELLRRNLNFLDFEDIMNYLVKTGYHFYGEYVIKGNQSYALICYDAILKYFPFDIKLDSNENNEDMRILRKIVDKNYHGLNLPGNNRALTARVASILVLSGRGRYCPIGKVIYSTKLLDEVYYYIQKSSQTSFFYNEIFAQFQGRFLLETNISNAHFLHGMLKYLYPDDFNFERDLMVKNGAERKGTDDRLCELLISKRSAMTKSEVIKAIPGLNDFVIAFAIARVPRLIQWDYNVYNHIDNISCDPNDLSVLEKLIAELMSKHSGYLSDALLFDSMLRNYPEIIEKNRMENALNLYYVVEYYFEQEYRFRRPHILAKDFPVTDLTVANIAKTLLGCDATLNYSTYATLAKSLGWAEGTLYSVFNEIVRDFIRISEDDYVHRDTFSVTDDFLNETIKRIGGLVEDSGYFGLSSIFNFDTFPDGPYNWNGFLLESLVDEYETGFKIIAPQVRDRRYQRGIIVRENASEMAFEDLVVNLLQKDGITKLTELDLIKFIKNKGLITGIVPQELYECSALPFKNEFFTVIR